MRATVNIPNHAELLRCVLDGMIAAGEILIRAGAAPPGPTADITLVHDRNERWQLPTETAERGNGDCEDMVIWRAASLRATGEDPEATAEIIQSGRRTLHCIVLRGDGSIEDIWQQMLDGTWTVGFSLNPLRILKAAVAPVAAAVAAPIRSFTGGRSSAPARAPNINNTGYSGTRTPTRYEPSAPPAAPPGTYQPPPQSPYSPYPGDPYAPYSPYPPGTPGIPPGYTGYQPGYQPYYPSAYPPSYPSYPPSYSSEPYAEPYADVPWYEDDIIDEDDAPDDAPEDKPKESEKESASDGN